MTLASDWTAVATGGIAATAAVLGALIGYLGARITASAARAASDAETTRAQEEAARQARLEREALYTAFLTQERAVFMFLRHGPADDWIGIEAQLDSLHPSLTPLILAGPASVARAAVELHSTLTRCASIAHGWNDGKVTVGEFDAEFAKWQPARQCLIDAMRGDVSADAVAVEWPETQLDDLGFYNPIQPA